MSNVQSMLSGKIEMSEFIRLLKTDPLTQEEVRSLVPNEAINNSDHVFWENIAFPSLKINSFDFIRFLQWMCKFDGTIGDNLNIFSAIQRAYLFYDPKFKCTLIYEDKFDLMLDVVKDIFDGPEVSDLIDRVIEKSLVLKTKKQRISHAKSEIHSLFHVVGSKRPRWIQGAEWPMGKHSPMEYIETKRRGEQVHYVFRDVDTNDIRIVTQMY